MKSLMALSIIGATAAGFGVAGLLGALTGLVASTAVASGLSIMFGSKDSELSVAPSERFAQQIGGLVSAVAALAGAYYGGWGWGAAWAVGGFFLGMIITVIIAALLRSPGEAPAEGSLELVSFEEFAQRTMGGCPNQMNTVLYQGAHFSCACGQQHVFQQGSVNVLHELTGMRLVLACPSSEAVTCVKVKGLAKFRGFQAQFGVPPRKVTAETQSA